MATTFTCAAFVSTLNVTCSPKWGDNSGVVPSSFIIVSEAIGSLPRVLRSGRRAHPEPIPEIRCLRGLVSTGPYALRSRPSLDSREHLLDEWGLADVSDMPRCD